MNHDNTNRNFKGQLADEQVVSFCRKHWLRVVPPFVGVLLFFLSPFVLALFLDKSDVQNFAGPTGFLFISGLYIAATTYCLHLLFVRIFNYFLRIFIITNHRIVDLKKTLFFRDQRTNIMLSEIQDVSMDKKGIAATIFNYGHIDIIISGSQLVMRINDIPNPDYLFRKIIKSRQECIARLSGARPHLVLPIEPLAAEPLKSIDYAGLF